MSDSACVPIIASAVPTAAVPLRHSALVRVTHWITTLCFLALLVSGVEIVISHPRFYWGEAGQRLTPTLFKLPIPASRALSPTGYGYVLPDQNGWSRYLHFQAAWAGGVDRLAVCNLPSCSHGHLRRDCSRTKRSVVEGVSRRQSRAICASSRPSEAEAWSYNVLQRLTYLFVIFVLFPLVIWTGLAMSPAFVSAFPAAVTVLGGQQSARTHSLFRLPVSCALSAGPRRDGLACRIQEPHAGDDHGPRRAHSMMERT